MKATVKIVPHDRVTCVWRKVGCNSPESIAFEVRTPDGQAVRIWHNFDNAMNHAQRVATQGVR